MSSSTYQPANSAYGYHNLSHLLGGWSFYIYLFNTLHQLVFCLLLYVLRLRPLHRPCDEPVLSFALEQEEKRILQTPSLLLLAFFESLASPFHLRYLLLQFNSVEELNHSLIRAYVSSISSHLHFLWVDIERKRCDPLYANLFAMHAPLHLAIRLPEIV